MQLHCVSMSVETMAINCEMARKRDGCREKNTLTKYDFIKIRGILRQFMEFNELFIILIDDRAPHKYYC